MFDIGLGEMLTLGVVALLVFGPERLPEVAVKAAGFVRKLRGVAASARSELSTSFGTDLDELRDLDPRTFVRRHVLDPADDDGTLRDLRNEVRANGRRGPRKSTTAPQAGTRANGDGASVDSTPGGSASPSPAPAGPAVPAAMQPAPLAAGEPPPYDDEAT